MLRLFKFEGYRVVISEEAYMLLPIKLIWDRDKSKGKDVALRELAYIYFMHDPRSDYMLYIDPRERHRQICIGEGVDPSWQPDEDLQAAIDFYNSFKPMSAMLLEDTRIAIDKLRGMLRDIDLNQLDDKGKPIYTLNTVTSTIKMIPDLVRGLDEAEKAINRDIALVSARMRGQGEKSIFEDGVSI